MKLLSLTVDRNDATSFYRANGVFGHLRTIMDLEITNYDFKTMPDMSWAELINYDVVFMQRPFTSMALQMAAFLKQMNKPLWVDYDDNLFAVPVDNKGHGTYSNPEVQQTIAGIATMADVVTVSTQPLKEVFSKIRRNVKLIPNAFNDYMLPQPSFNGTNNTALWRGSDTHQIDLMTCLREITNLQHKFTDTQFVYFGYNPIFIEQTPNKKYHGPTDPVLYFKQVADIKPRVIHVPLLMSNFNLCKSNIAYIEGTYAGAVCVVPDMLEWNNLPGALVYKTPKQFYDHVKSVIKGTVNTDKLRHQAWKHITDNLLLSNVNLERKQLLNDLVKC